MARVLAVLSLVCLQSILNCLSSQTSTGSGLPELCEQCPGVVRNEGVVMRECEREGGEIVDRCCVRRECDNCSAEVIGLDWSDCNLTTLVDYTFSDVGDTLATLDVSGNDITNTSISSRAFGGLVNLTILSLPPTLECSDTAWTSSNETENSTICYHPVWPCEWRVIEAPEGGYNMTDDIIEDDVYWTNVTNSTSTDLCPDHAHCVPDGPGLHQCLCSSGYHGYKCLLQGTFPYAAFFGSSVGGAVVVMAIYWGMRVTDKLLRTRNIT